MDEDTENNGKGQKSMVKTFLSLEIWQPLGKLTYTMYLIHLIVYGWWATDLQRPTYYTVWNNLLLVLGIWFIVASFAMVLWFVVEKPISNLVILFLKWIMHLIGGKESEPKDEPLLFEDRAVNHFPLAREDRVTGIDSRKEDY